jgi:hypothetical protein
MAKLLRSLPVFFFLLCFLGVRAQDDDGPPASEKPDTFRLELAAVGGRVSHSLYSQVEVIDEFAEGGTIGWLSDGSYYGIRVCLADSLDVLLGRVFHQLVDSTAGSANLLIEVRRFIVYDDKVPRASLNFRLFAETSGLYSWIADVDSTATVRVAAAGRGGLRKFSAAVNGAISAIIAGALRKGGDSAAGLFTRATVRFADRIWEKRLPLYQTNIYPDGVYTYYTSFAQLQPDYTKFDVPDTAHPEYYLPPQQVYAFVLKGKAYISSDGVYTPLINKGSDYFIIGKVRIDAPGADAAADLAGFVAVVASMGKLPFLQVWGLTVKRKFLLLLDYRTGRWDPIQPAD